MNAPAYINNAHKALVRNPGGLTLEELSGKLRAKALKVSQQIRELHDAGLIETVEEAGQPVYKLKAAPVAESAENGRADIPPPQYDPASVAFPAADAAIPTKTYGPSVLRAIISDLSGDSEGGETDAPAVDAQREEFTLLGLIADIRAAAGDPDGRLMQDELVQHIAGVVKERDLLKAENLALKTLEGSMPGFGAEHQELRINSLTTDVINTRNALTNAINEADRLRAELATERQAREALQEQSDEVDVKDAAVGYLVRVPKRAPILRRKPDSARSAALSAVRAGAARAEVLAVVPVGTARRGAEWQSTEAGG